MARWQMGRWAGDLSLDVSSSCHRAWLCLGDFLSSGAFHEPDLICWVIRMPPQGAQKENMVLGRQMWPASLRESRLEVIASQSAGAGVEAPSLPDRGLSLTPRRQGRRWAPEAEWVGGVGCVGPCFPSCCFPVHARLFLIVNSCPSHDPSEPSQA